MWVSLNTVLAEPILEIISVLRHFRKGEKDSNDCDVECETIVDGNHREIWDLWFWCRIECREAGDYAVWPVLISLSRFCLHAVIGGRRKQRTTYSRRSFSPPS